MIPLYQTPNFVAFRATIRNVVSATGHELWNAENWWLGGVALAAAIAVSLLAVSGAGGAPAQTPKRGGTVVVSAGQEPAVSQSRKCQVRADRRPASSGKVLEPAFEFGTRLHPTAATRRWRDVYRGHRRSR